MLAALVVGVYPSYLYLAGTFYPQTQAMLLLAVGLTATVHATRAAGRARWAVGAGAGLAFGALVLTVPSFSWSVLAVLGWLALRRATALVAVVLVTAVALPAAWTIRNAEQLHALIPITSDSGAQLLLGNNANATPGSGVNVDVSRYRPTRPLGELALDRHYRRAALDWIGDHKGHAAVLYLGKAAHYFAFRNALATSSERARRFAT